MPSWKRSSFSAVAAGSLLLAIGCPGFAADTAYAQPDGTQRPLRFHHDVLLRESPDSLQAVMLPPGGSQLSLQPTKFTPYDRFVGNVRFVINHLPLQTANMALACRLMEEGRRFHYVLADPYLAQSPAITASEQAGDCKAKALWLYHELGDANALFVIGKAARNSRASHAWVYWRNEDRWWILDCTNRSEPIAAESVTSDRYIPYYSYGRNGAYRHKATSLLANSPSGAPVIADHADGLRSAR